MALFAVSVLKGDSAVKGVVHFKQEVRNCT